MSELARKPATLEDLEAIPEEERFHELLDGEIVRKAEPSAEHGDAQTGVITVLGPPFKRQRPKGFPVTLPPDWICEIVSPNNPNHDTIKKLRLYQRIALRHYWLLDLRDSTLTVMRYSPDGFITLLRAARNERVRAEPFEKIEIEVGMLFGDDPS